MTLDELTVLNGGRVPVGINPAVARGPFEVTSAHTGEWTLWTVGGQLLDFNQRLLTIATVSGGGLTAPRTVTASGSLPSGLQLSSST